jgi:hypothetical protein
MTASHWALLISGLALATSIGGFVWSIWKEFIYVKPKAYVSFAIMKIFGRRSPVNDICNLTATNLGPGPVVLHMCVTRNSRGVFRKPQQGFLNPIEGDPLVLPHISQGPFSGGLPASLEPGQSKSFYFPYVADSFLKEPITQIGVHDTYGRSHWCKKRDITKARNQHRDGLQPVWMTPD